jgi:hypothetical protein
MEQQIPHSSNPTNSKQVKQGGSNNIQAITISLQFLANLTRKFFVQFFG